MTKEPLRLRIHGLVEELKRRRVFRVLLAYAVIGFAVAQGAGIVVPALGFPGWTVNLVVVMVVLGLPVALGLGWALGVAPNGGREATGAAVEEVSPGHDRMPTRWIQVQDLFMQALDRPEGGREAFLAEATAGDVALLEEVRSLLRAHDRQGPLDELRERVVAPLIDEVRSVTDLEGRTLLRYEIRERLGGGGMGVVYKALDTRLDRMVALKFLSAHLLSDPEAKGRFLVEAQSAASLDHPNICTIHEIGETDDGRLFIAMSFYDGETLERRIARGRVPVEEALDITSQVCQGLARAAERGILHRDVKPGNLILTDDGTLKIVDFGLAKMADGELTRTGARMGTVSYMSPEQTRGDGVDQRTDVWSIGVVLYEMLTGQRPFRGGTDQAIIHAILNETPVPAQELVPGLAPGVGALVERAMQKDRARRYPDAANLLRDVDRLLADPESRGPIDTAPSLPPEGERRLVTVLSCAVSGFETLLETLEPDAVDHELARLRSRLQGVVEDYGGVLNEFSEHQMVALFGVPVTHEDDALRAVRAALEIHGRHRADPTLAAVVVLRSAVGSGHVVIRATEVGDRPYRIGGRVAKDVARLAAASGAGEVVVFPDLARALVPFVDAERRSPVTLAVEEGPVTPLAVLGELDVDSRLDASVPGNLTRFVGRTSELGALMRALEGANAGSGSLVTIVGDAGVGKSRLLHEFKTAVADEGIRYLQGRCQAYGSLTPFLPFIECLKSMLGLARSQPGQTHDQVVERTRALAPELELYVPVLLHLLSIESEEHAVPEYLTGVDLRAALGEALVSMFTLGARGQPLVLLIEDWHWSDGGSNDVLDQLAEMISAYPVLLVVTSRPESESGRALPRGQAHMDLAPLDQSAAAEVMRAAFRGARVPAELAKRLAEKTGGNPFFIEELCHTLLETETVVLDGGQARLAGSMDRLTIPDTVQAVLKTRLDRLDPEAREVLRSASVIGRQFGLRLLGEVVPSQPRLEAALDGLRASGLIQRTSLLPEPTYRFKHALTLDVTYDSLLERQRKERHALVGLAVEALYGDRLEELSERLADHFAVAQDWDRAVRYGLAAADRAASLYRTHEAVATLERTREWLERRGGGDAANRNTLVRLLLDQERHLETVGHRDRQQAVIDELLALVAGATTPERATVLVRQGELSTLLGDDPTARSAFARALEVADACGAVEVRAMALRGVGHAFWRRGEYDDALAPLTEVVEYDRDHATPTVLLRDLVNLGRVLRERGEWDQAQAIGEEARTIAETTANPVDLVYAWNYLGHLYRTMGQPGRALQAFESGSAVAAEAHLPVRHAFNALATGALHMEMGNVDASLTAYEEAVQLGRRASRSDTLAHALTLHGDALMTVGRQAEAVPIYEEACALLEEVAVHAVFSDTLAKLALAYEAAGRAESLGTWLRVKGFRIELRDRAGVLQATEHEARLRDGGPRVVRPLQEEALSLALELQDRPAEARIRNSLAILCWREGDLDGASEHYAAAVGALREQESPEGLGAVLNGWGAVLARAGRWAEARGVLMEALDINRESGEDSGEADSLAALGAALRGAGDLTRAYDWYQQCLERRRALGDLAGEGWALLRLAELSVDAEAQDRAQAFVSAGLALAREVGDRELERLLEEQ